jgi:hypothetical protein
LYDQVGVGMNGRLMVFFLLSLLLLGTRKILRSLGLDTRTTAALKQVEIGEPLFLLGCLR